jgi:hypothetical protein
MEGVLLWDAKCEEIDREAWRMASPEGARGKSIGAI